MTNSIVTCSLLLIAPIALICADDNSTEPSFPRLLNPDRGRIQIKSRWCESDGNCSEVEEYIDLNIGKSAYTETINNTETTYLFSSEDDTAHRYTQYTCDSLKLASNFSESPSSSANGGVILYGVSGMFHMFSEDSPKQYKRISNDSKISHRWSITKPQFHAQVIFSETSSATGHQQPELLLESIENQVGELKSTIIVSGWMHKLASEVYENKFQLPLTSGCRRGAKLSDLMQAKFEILKSHTKTRHHFRGQAKARNYADGRKPAPTESTDVQLAFSLPKDADDDQKSPVRAHMTYQRNSQVNSRTVVDHYLNVKYEADLTRRTCTISNVGTLNPPIDDKSNPISLTFSDELQLNISARDLEEMLYGIKEESFMRLEWRDSTEYALFADSFPEAFGAAKLGRVVKEFSFGENGSAKLENIHILIFNSDGGNLKRKEGYFFIISQSESLDSPAKSAEVFDMSRECYLNNEMMQQGRDYAWFELSYSLTSGQVGEIRNRIDELKDSFFNSMRAKMNLNYLRVPEMNVTFAGDDSNLTLRMLTLDSVPLHLIYDEFESKVLSTQSSKKVDSLYDCSEFCSQNSCTGLTFDRLNNKCMLAKSSTESGDSFLMVPYEGAVSYRVDESKQNLLPQNNLRLARLIEALESSSSEILITNEMERTGSTRNHRGFCALLLEFDHKEQPVKLKPCGCRVFTSIDS